MAGISKADARTEQSCAARIRLGILSTHEIEKLVQARCCVSDSASASDWENHEVVRCWSVNRRARGGGDTKDGKTGGG
jgi:hypothetical protein